MENSFYGMTFYNETLNTTIVDVINNETNITAVKIAAAVFVAGMSIATCAFCIRERLIKKPAFDAI